MSNNATVSQPLAADPANSSNDMAATVMDRVKAFIPDISNLYLQPLDPSSDMTLSDRVRLIWQSARPVTEFLDISSFNLPPIEHVTTRVGHNIETYLYNYFLLVCLHLILFSMVHFGSVFVLICWVGLLYFLYVLNKDKIDVAGKFSIDSNTKLIIAVVTGLVALLFGKVWTLVMSLAVFLLIVVGIHSILRDDVRDTSTADIGL